MPHFKLVTITFTFEVHYKWLKKYKSLFFLGISPCQLIADHFFQLSMWCVLQGFVLHEFTNKLCALFVTCWLRAHVKHFCLIQRHYILLTFIYWCASVKDSFLAWWEIFWKSLKKYMLPGNKKQGIRVKSKKGKQLIEGKFHLGQKRID